MQSKYYWHNIDIYVRPYEKSDTMFPAPPKVLEPIFKRAWTFLVKKNEIQIKLGIKVKLENFFKSVKWPFNKNLKNQHKALLFEIKNLSFNEVYFYISLCMM